MIIGLDVGGTHTDVVLLSRKGLQNKIKVHTNSADLFQTVLEGLNKITEAIDPDKIKRIVLSTTLTTNAIVQQKLEKVGMIVLSGPGMDPMLFKTNEDFAVVEGVMDHRGREIIPVNENEIRHTGERFREKGIRQIGVVGKFSVRNPSHEIKILRILEDLFDVIFLGHHVSGNLNLPRRIATTFLNAAVYPLHKEFFQAVRASLKRKGLNIPIHLLKADGGTMSFESSVHYPAQTIFSGPAASVMGAIACAPEKEDIIVLDIGGTTTDISVLIDSTPILEPLGVRFHGYRTLIRALNTRSVGIGGDSHVRVEEGRLKIGPERLGPAMAYGGPVPTPTDAIIVLSGKELGDYQKALDAVDSIASELSISTSKAANQIFDLACRQIIQEVEATIQLINSQPVYTVHELLDGYQINPKKIMILGGPAKDFALRLEAISDYSVGVVQSWEVANAIGAALARTTNETTLFADTFQGFAAISDEDQNRSIDHRFSVDEAVTLAVDALKKKEIENGAKKEDLEIEVIEKFEFKMVRNFMPAGSNIRVKVQVKPGLIHGYEPL